jgi:hypothetical protein
MRYGLSLAIGMVCLLAGCATPNTTRSVVAEAPAADNAVVALVITNYIRDQLPPAQTVLIVDPAIGEDQILVRAIEAALRRRGFAIGDAKGGEPGAKHLRIETTAIPAGLLVRVLYGIWQVGVFFERNPTGSLQAVQPFARREVG